MKEAAYISPVIKLYMPQSDILEEPPVVSSLYNDQPALSREQEDLTPSDFPPTTDERRRSIWDE